MKLGGILKFRPASSGTIMNCLRYRITSRFGFIFRNSRAVDS